MKETGPEYIIYLNKLESLDKSESLINTTANRKIIDGHLSDNSFWINNEQTTESNSSFFNEDSKVSGDIFIEVWHQGVVEAAQTSLFSRLIDPGQVREVTVSGDTNDLTVDVLELLDSVREGDDLGGADKGKVKWIEVDNKIFALNRFFLN